MSKKNRKQGHSVEVVGSIAPESAQNDAQSSQETSGTTNDAPSSESTQETTPVVADAPKSAKRPPRPVVALTDAQRETLHAAVSLLYGKFSLTNDDGSPVVLTTKDVLPVLRVARATYKGKTPSVSRSGKSDEQRKSERTAYRFARRYARKHGISIDAARDMYAKGKISPSVRVTVDASDASSLDAQIARLMEARKRLSESATVGNDAPSAPDALALAAQIDAQLAAQE